LAAEQNGATDRLALDVFALQLWLHDLGSALTGIGLGVFFALTPFTAFGYPTVVHNTYLWLPVEMGLPGVVALIAFAYAAIWLLRACWRYHRGDFTTIAVGSFALFGTWGALNEGLYQRTLWLLFAVLSAVVAPVMMSPGDGRRDADPANRN
jgi:O-antigen ligase